MASSGRLRGVAPSNIDADQNTFLYHAVYLLNDARFLSSSDPHRAHGIAGGVFEVAARVFGAAVEEKLRRYFLDPEGVRKLPIGIAKLFGREVEVTREAFFSVATAVLAAHYDMPEVVDAVVARRLRIDPKTKKLLRENILAEAATRKSFVRALPPSRALPAGPAASAGDTVADEMRDSIARLREKTDALVASLTPKERALLEARVSGLGLPAVVMAEPDEKERTTEPAPPPSTPAAPNAPSPSTPSKDVAAADEDEEEEPTSQKVVSIDKRRASGG